MNPLTMLSLDIAVKSQKAKKKSGGSGNVLFKEILADYYKLCDVHYAIAS
jgi:hypothetical protein